MSLREKLRVMVVDDMSTSRGLITQALDAIGIQNIATAADGKSALLLLSEWMSTSWSSMGAKRPSHDFRLRRALSDWLIAIRVR